MFEVMTMLPAASDALDVTDEDDDAVWPPVNETTEARSARVERERIMIEEAEEDFRQGRFIEGDELKEWLRKWAAGEPVSTDFG